MIAQMTTETPQTKRPTVSVIVPARNEEENLRTCLESLVQQQGVDFEVIVVDDASTDSTRQIASSFPGVRVLEARPLPSGWSGKANALFCGARVASGDWLLFTDADTVHLSGSLARAVIEAVRHGASLLSYSPQQEVDSLSEKAVMPVIFAELAATYRPSLISDSRSPAAAANGQYLLISREAYDAVGGWATVSKDLLEDVAIARAVKASGRKLLFRYGSDAVRTRMYRSFQQLREGWTKNLVLLFPSPVRLATLRFLEFVLIAGSGGIVVRLFALGHLKLAVAGTVLFAILYGSFLNRIRKAHFRLDADLFALFGLPTFSYLLLRSKVAHAEGQVTWKGRTYSSSSRRGNRSKQSRFRNTKHAAGVDFSH